MSVPSTPLFSSILLVEDEASHALLIKRAMKMLVGEVVHCFTLAEALSILRQRDFDLIVTDLHLPDAPTGIHLASYDEVSDSSPVIVLTASTAVHEAVTAMREGASDFIVKTFDGNFEQALHLSFERVVREARLKRERLKLQRQMAALRIAIENGSDALAVIRGVDSVEYFNSAFSEFVERSGGAQQGLLDCFGAGIKDCEKLVGDLKKQLRELPVGAAWNTEVSLKEGSEASFALNLSVIRDDAECREAVLWLRDISDQKRRERFQREILSTTTHDLKGPLGAIMISADLVRDMIKEHEKAVELVTRIASSAHGAVNLIDEFLSARRIQEGAFVLRPSDCSVQGILEEVVSGFEPAAHARKLKLTVNAPSELTFRVDRLAFHRVMGNLVSNALKFTKAEGEVRVEARSEGDIVLIEVADTGQGMEPSEVAKLFEKFGRLERHSDVEGSGIGLFVVRSIVTAHGGQVQVTSKPGQGTTFALRIPKVPILNDRGELIAV